MLRQAPHAPLWSLAAEAEWSTGERRRACACVQGEESVVRVGEKVSISFRRSWSVQGGLLLVYITAGATNFCCCRSVLNHLVSGLFFSRRPSSPPLSRSRDLAVTARPLHSCFIFDISPNLPLKKIIDPLIRRARMRACFGSFDELMMHYSCDRQLRLIYPNSPTHQIQTPANSRTDRAAPSPAQDERQQYLSPGAILCQPPLRLTKEPQAAATAAAPEQYPGQRAAPPVRPDGAAGGQRRR